MKTNETLICCKCGGIGKPSKALNNQNLYSKPDEIGKITIYQNAGKAKLLDCIKCESCGHSWIPEKSTRELALKWWNNQHISAKNFLENKHFGFRTLKSLTGREIEEIWNKEVNSNQKVFVEVELSDGQVFLDKQKPKMQYTQFSEELFMKYISKFSDEDKLKALEKLMRALDCEEAKLINDGFNLSFQYKQF